MIAFLCPPTVSQSFPSHSCVSSSPACCCGSKGETPPPQTHVSIGRETVLLDMSVPTVQSVFYFTDNLYIWLMQYSWDTCEWFSANPGLAMLWFPKHCHERKKSQRVDICTTAEHYIPFFHHCALFSKKDNKWSTCSFLISFPYLDLGPMVRDAFSTTLQISCHMCKSLLVLSCAPLRRVCLRPLNLLQAGS